MTTDEGVIQRINELADEEHELFEKEGEGRGSETDRERLEQVGVLLDQCYDLLRQRRAKRRAGLDPELAQMRDEDTVENYQG